MALEKLVKNFMHKLDHYSYIKEDETVREAISLMDKLRKRNTDACLFVVGKKQKEAQLIKGFIRHSELVFGLFAHFLKGAEKSGPVFWEGQLEAECAEGIEKCVVEIMVPIMACVQENNMLMEAIFLLNKYKVDFLPVLKRDDVVGTIHINDIAAYIAELSSSAGSGYPRIKSGSCLSSQV